MSSGNDETQQGRNSRRMHTGKFFEMCAGEVKLRFLSGFSSLLRQLPEQIRAVTDLLVLTASCRHSTISIRLSVHSSEDLLYLPDLDTLVNVLRTNQNWADCCLAILAYSYHPMFQGRHRLADTPYTPLQHIHQSLLYYGAVMIVTLLLSYINLMCTRARYGNPEKPSL